MGRASSSKKVARAAKAAGRPGTKKSLVWPATLGLVVLLGVGLIAVSAVGRESGASDRPILGDHFHAAFGVYGCDEFLPPVEIAGADENGIHTHGDGLMHIEPRSTRYTGAGANIGAFGETVAIDLDDDSIVMPGGQTYADGDDCGGEPGVVQVKVWTGPDDTEGRLLEADFADYAMPDNSLVTVAFAPEGAEIPQPPSAGAQEGGGAGVVTPTSTTIPAGGEPTDGDAGTGDDAEAPTEEPVEGDDGTTATTGADEADPTEGGETTTSTP